MPLNLILFALLSVIYRDVVLTKKVWERSKKTAILKQLRTHFKAKHEKGAGTQFPRVPAPLHLWIFSVFISAVRPTRHKLARKKTK